MVKIPKCRRLLPLLGLCTILMGCGSTYKNHQLLAAAHKGDVKKVKKLISQGADPDAKDDEGFNAYLAASSNGHMETMRYLESLGAKQDPGF